MSTIPSNPYASRLLNERPAPREPLAASGHSAASEPANGLSKEEASMIQEFFPERPDLRQRLYQRDRSTIEVQTHRLGSRIDLHG